ncbi:MAG: ABC transporter substrate-binding protein [Sporichthyaceae bacterium]
MSRSGKRTSAIAAVAALGVLLAGCAGTRVSDEEIERAAGVNQVVQAAAATDATSADTSSAADATASTDTASTDTASTDTASADTTAAAPSAEGTTAAAPAPGKKGAAGTAAVGAAKGTAGSATTAKAPAAGTPAKPAAGKPLIANKSVVKVGVVGTFSGPVGGLVKDTVTGIRVWAQDVNLRGGVNGHPVEVLVGDDGGDPARYISLQRQFVEQKGVIAFVYGTLGFSPNGNNKYLNSKKIFTFGTEGGLDQAYKEPYVLSPQPTGHVNADSILYALSKVALPKGKTKLAAFSCSDFGLCDNFDDQWTDPETLKQIGFVPTVSGRPSLTQPDYTSQCLAAKNAGAEVVMMALDTASLRRFASDCIRQNYNPIFGTADTLALGNLPEDPKVEGLIVAAKNTSWIATEVPGVKALHTAVAKFLPGTIVSGGFANGWTIAKFFEAAAQNLPDNPTPEDVANGVYSIKNNNLDGMTYPITMTRGKPMATQMGYGVVTIKDKAYVSVPGPALYVHKDYKPFGKGAALTAPAAAPANSEPMAVQPSPVRAALRTAQPVVATSASAPRAGCGPARVAGISYLLDGFQTGSGAGPGVFYGVALAVIGTPLPEPFAQAQGMFLAEGQKFADQARKDFPAAIQTSRSFFEPFAAYNSFGNGFIDAGANSLDAGADSLGPVIQPGDRSMKQTADAFRDAKVDEKPCGA